jgi:hypothetical protein
MQAHMPKEDVFLEISPNLWKQIVENAPNLHMPNCSTTRKKNKTPLREQ